MTANVTKTSTYAVTAGAKLKGSLAVVKTVTTTTKIISAIVLESANIMATSQTINMTLVIIKAREMIATSTIENTIAIITKEKKSLVTTSVVIMTIDAITSVTKSQKSVVKTNATAVSAICLATGVVNQKGSRLDYLLHKKLLSPATFFIFYYCTSNLTLTLTSLSATDVMRNV